jgi:endonuclease G, mitochondrial
MRTANGVSYVYLWFSHAPVADPPQKYEVIGNPPNVAVPTHFAKVLLTARPASPSTPHIPEISTGAFVLPNESIPDDVPLQRFVVPVEAVEKAAGLQLFADDIKKVSRHVCQSAQCQLEVRRFDDAQKQLGMDKKVKAIAAPGSK